MFNLNQIVSVVKTVKSMASLNLGCQGTHNIRLKDVDVLSQVKAVEKMLEIESSAQIIDTNVTNEILKTAGDMFLYLIMCPDDIKAWLLFYKDLLQTQSPDQILLTINRLMKGQRTLTNQNFQNIAGIVLKRILSKLLGKEDENTTSNTEPSQEFRGKVKSKVFS